MIQKRHHVYFNQQTWNENHSNDKFELTFCTPATLPFSKHTCNSVHPTANYLNGCNAYQPCNVVLLHLLICRREKNTTTITILHYS